MLWPCKPRSPSYEAPSRSIVPLPAKLAQANSRVEEGIAAPHEVLPFEVGAHGAADPVEEAATASIEPVQHHFHRGIVPSCSTNPLAKAQPRRTSLLLRQSIPPIWKMERSIRLVPQHNLSNGSSARRPTTCLWSEAKHSKRREIEIEAWWTCTGTDANWDLLANLHGSQPLQLHKTQKLQRRKRPEE